jgi:hypothetical protein
VNGATLIPDDPDDNAPEVASDTTPRPTFEGMTPIAQGPRGRWTAPPPDPRNVFEHALRNAYRSGQGRADIGDRELSQAERELLYEPRNPNRYGW